MHISTTKVSSVVLRPEKSWKSENSGKGIGIGKGNKRYSEDKICPDLSFTCIWSDFKLLEIHYNVDFFRGIYFPL
jgi:hypothetical protein